MKTVPDPDAHANAAALLSAWHAHAAACRLYAASLCRWPDDVTQEAFVRLMRHLQTKPPPDHPRAWLLTAVRSAAADLGKSETRRRRREQAVAMFDVASSAPTQDADVQAALETLPQLQREAIVLRLWCGLSFEDVATLLAVSPSTAHGRYTAGLDQLRQLLQDDD